MPYDGRRGGDGGSRRSGGPRGSRGSDSRRAPSGAGRSRGSDVRGRRSGGGGPSRPGAPSFLDDLFNSDIERELPTRRKVVMGLLAAALGRGVWQLADYQIVNAETYRDRADQRRVSRQTLFSKRGTIYDRNGVVLTSSVECSNVYANPRNVEHPRAAAKALAELLGVDEDEALEKVERDTTFVYIKRQVDQDVADELMEREIAGIELEPATKRLYPNDALASQIIGVVNADNEGVSGLESRYDDVLRGEDGWIARERARDGSFIAGGAYEKVEAQDGTDLVLTIDADIQRTCEDVMARALEESQPESASALVMDPRTGEILACCSAPSFDPGDLANANSADMNLRMVSDAYEPGSVFKALVTGMACDLGVVDPDTTFAVPPQVQVGDYMVSDVDDRSYGLTMTVREIMRRSSNTGMVLVGREVGADNFAEYLDSYGITENSGLDFPGESAGVIQSRDEYDGSSLGSMSFGQGISVAPVRVARAIASIANGGVLCTPHFVMTEDGEQVDHSGEERRAISDTAAEEVTSMMVTVVDEGSGDGGQIEGYDVAGKTGTAQRADGKGGYEESRFMSSFVCFAPAQDPRVLVYVTLNGTHRSSAAAAPLAREIMQAALDTLGVKPTR